MVITEDIFSFLPLKHNYGASRRVQRKELVTVRCSLHALQEQYFPLHTLFKPELARIANEDACIDAAKVS